MTDPGQPDPPEAARVVWFELRTPDLERSARFCSALFGWRFTPFEDYRSDYWLVEGPARGLGGALVAGEPGSPSGPGTAVYVEVPALAPALERARSLGARVLVGSTPITAGAGVFAVVADPCGVPIGLWAAA